MKNIWNDPRSLFNGNHFSSNWRASEVSETLSGLFNRESYIYILEKWFPLWGERVHSLKLFCMYDKRFEI